MSHRTFSRRLALVVLACFTLAAGPATTRPMSIDRPAFAPGAANPILPGYYADPSVVQHDGKAFIYATLDPWGGDTLGCWESGDWKHWTYRTLNWPTKAACTSRTSAKAKVWAPSVVRGRDGKFHMVVSVGSEVWAGVADHPLGPWRNALGEGVPMIPGDFRPGFHMIDAELFVDDDGQPYVYWGSGWNWTNGRCFVARLKPDFATLDGEVRDVTPTHYFEAPIVLKRGGRYYLMYSDGKTTEDTYQVHYAIGDTPFGPFKEGPNSPILTTDAANDVISPGHHTVFERDGRTFVLYHRHSVRFDPKFVGRQLCVDELTFDAAGAMNKVTPTHDGPPFVRRDASPLAGATWTASSQAKPFTGPDRAGDDNHATRWAAAADDRAPWLQLDLGRERAIAAQEIRPEYAWKPYRFAVQASTDGQAWQTLADFRDAPATGSPIVVDKPTTARYLRLTFAEGTPDASVWSWSIR